ncbi:MAG: carboxyltransferase domain-containing protein [Rhodobacteraceae bacterium]|nr:carboxyltransferase domain-containing protein [Paracoccaceae bacterium]
MILASLSLDGRAPSFPFVRPMGLDALLVSFANRFTEAPNRAALAFRAELECLNWAEVAETAPTLVSVVVRLVAGAQSSADVSDRLRALLQSRDWYDAPLPDGRRHWRIPTVFGGSLAPGLDSAAQAAGVDTATAITEWSQVRVRVLTIGFAPGQPYLGVLPPRWDIPRQTSLTPRVPQGALVQAVRQFVLFSRPSPTGWRHVGQTAFRSFRPGATVAFPLRPGDEISFVPTDRDHIERLLADPDGSDGGAEAEQVG